MSLLLLANYRTLAAQSQGLLAQAQERAVQYQALAAQAHERAALAQQAQQAFERQAVQAQERAARAQFLAERQARETTQQERLLAQATERVRARQTRVAEQRLLVKALTLVRVVKEIERDQMVSELPDACGICLENHRKSNSCSLSWNHEFAIKCFNGWKKISKKKSFFRFSITRDTYIHTLG